MKVPLHLLCWGLLLPALVLCKDDEKKKADKQQLLTPKLASPGLRGGDAVAVPQVPAALVQPVRQAQPINQPVTLGLKIVNPPTAIKLNDRHTPTKVAYQGVQAPVELHVDLKGANGEWLGGGMTVLKDATGTASVDTEVRVPPTYTGGLTLVAYLTKVGDNNNQLVQSQPIVGLGIDPTPIDAIGVLCQPTVVGMGNTFNLNLWYTQTHARPNKLIAVALNAETKQYYGGCAYDITEQQGELTCRFDLHRGSTFLPLKFKAWIGGPAPDYDSYTMIALKPGDWTQNDCPNIGFNNRSPPGVPPANWVDLKYVPTTIPVGSTINVDVETNLVTANTAEVHLALMTWNWDTHGSDPIATTTVTVLKGRQQGTITLDIPPNARNGKDGEYFMVYMAPVGGGYETSLGEDRHYEVSLGGRNFFPAARGNNNWNNNNNNNNNWNNNNNDNNNGRGEQQVDAQEGQGNGGLFGFGWVRGGW